MAGFAILWAFNYYLADNSETIAKPPVNSVRSALTAVSQQQPNVSRTTVPPILAVPLPAPVTEIATSTQSTIESQIGAVVEQPSTVNFGTVLANLAGAPTPMVVAPQNPDSVTIEEIADEDNYFFAIGTNGDDLLRISFSGESWVEVNDSDSIQIYRDIREAGDILQITGSAPFNILIGDAPYIRLSLNGTEIDVSDDIRIDNSARLTVGL